MSRCVYFHISFQLLFFGGKKVVQKVVPKKSIHTPKLAINFKVLKLQRGQLVRVRIIDLNQEEGKLQVSMLQPMPKMPGKKITDGDWLLPFVDCCFFFEQRWTRRGVCFYMLGCVLFGGFSILFVNYGWLETSNSNTFAVCIWVFAFFFCERHLTWNPGVPMVKMQKKHP